MPIPDEVKITIIGTVGTDPSGWQATVPDPEKTFTDEMGQALSLETMVGAINKAAGQNAALAGSEMRTQVTLINRDGNWEMLESDKRPEDRVANVIMEFSRDGNQLAHCEQAFRYSKWPDSPPQYEINIEQFDSYPTAEEQKIGTSLMCGFLEGVQQNFKPGSPDAVPLELRMCAIDTGTYAWLNFGFVPSADDWNDMRESFREHTHYDAENQRLDIYVWMDPDNAVPDGYEEGEKYLLGSVRMNAEEYEAFTRIIDSSDPKKAWALAELTQQVELDERVVKDIGFTRMSPNKLGKALLWNRSWSGDIDLADADVKQKLNAYLMTRLGLQEAPFRE